MSEAIYPTIRNAIFSAVMDYFGWEDGDEDSFATELTDQIIEALREGDPLDFDDSRTGSNVVPDAPEQDERWNG
jgi:hypothetical protein